MPTPAATKGSDSPKLRDGTTGFRCGAAHRGEEFADSAIRKYLAESIRSIPRSRSGLLVPVLVVPFAASRTLLGSWLPSAALGAGPGRHGRRISRHGRGPRDWVASASALSFVPCRVTGEPSRSDRHSRYYGEPESGTAKVSTGRES